MSDGRSVERRCFASVLVLALVACSGSSGDTPVDAGHTDAGDAGHVLPDGRVLCTDLDADGHGDPACGGDDCDDTNPARYPGNLETCDEVDNDCDAATLGPDRDGDGEPATSCCNAQPAGAMLCGGDCDDMRATVNTSAIEVCDGVDDDCDGSVDEAVTLTLYRDIDGDGYGDDGMTMPGCAAILGWAIRGGDCMDMDGGLHPGAADGPTVACDGVDNDCDGTPDLGCACTDGMTQTCGAVDGTGAFITTAPCHTGTSTCVGGAFSACVGAVMPADETCNAMDDDCDGAIDDGVTIGCYQDGDDDGYPTPGATLEQECPNASRPSHGSCPLHFTNRAPGGTSDDCNDAQPSVHPGAGEVCSSAADDDCSGIANDGCPCKMPPRTPVGTMTITLNNGRTGAPGSPIVTIDNYDFRYSLPITGPGPMQAVYRVTCHGRGDVVLPATTLPPTGGGSTTSIYLPDSAMITASTVAVMPDSEQISINIIVP